LENGRRKLEKIQSKGKSLDVDVATVFVWAGSSDEALKGRKPAALMDETNS